MKKMYEWCNIYKIIMKIKNNNKCTNFDNNNDNWLNDIRNEKAFHCVNLVNRNKYLMVKYLSEKDSYKTAVLDVKYDNVVLSPFEEDSIGAISYDGKPFLSDGNTIDCVESQKLLTSYQYVYSHDGIKQMLYLNPEFTFVFKFKEGNNTDLFLQLKDGEEDYRLLNQDTWDKLYLSSVTNNTTGEKLNHKEVVKLAAYFNVDSI